MKKSKINEFNILYVTVQFVLTIISLIFAILSIFVNKSFYKYLELFMGLDLLMIGFNNYRIYKRKNITVVYLVVGVFMLIISILTFIGVI